MLKGKANTAHCLRFPGDWYDHSCLPPREKLLNTPIQARTLLITKRWFLDPSLVCLMLNYRAMFCWTSENYIVDHGEKCLWLSSFSKCILSSKENFEIGSWIDDPSQLHSLLFGQKKLIVKEITYLCTYLSNLLQVVFRAGFVTDTICL